MTSLTTARLQTMGINDYNVTMTSADFLEDTTYFSNMPAGTSGYCSGTSGGFIGYFTQSVIQFTCNKLIFDTNSDGGLLDPEQCSSIENCEVKNKTVFWVWGNTNVTYCDGYVNLSHYNMSDVNRFTICESDLLLYNKINCDMFACNWINITEKEGTTNLYNPKCSDFFCSVGNFFSTIFKAIGLFLTTIMWVLLFKVDIGLGTFNPIFSMIFFYIPFIALIYAVAKIWK
jgi:hypothetical protein